MGLVHLMAERQLRIIENTCSLGNSLVHMITDYCVLEKERGGVGGNENV